MSGGRLPRTDVKKKERVGRGPPALSWEMSCPPGPDPPRSVFP